MKKLTPHEKLILEHHKENNFRDVTKDNVKEVVTIFEKLDPEVAKALIEKMPEAISGMVEIETFYFDLLKNAKESFESTTLSCFETEDTLIDSYSQEMKKDIPFEQKQYFAEQMKAAAERKEKKDTEHRESWDKLLKYGGMALTFGLGILAVIFLGGNSSGSTFDN